MKAFFERVFHVHERGSNFKTEVVGGLLTFIAMSYIMPLNASILSATGMNQVGVFVMTGVVSCISTLIMAIVANYPIALSAGMGLNAYLAFTLSNALFTSWQQKMILLTISGLLFFVFSLSPIRRKLIEAIPQNLKGIISASLGVFIMFVGLKGTGLIANDDSTLVGLGNFLDPAVVIGFIAVVATIGLTFSKRHMVSTLAVPIGIAGAALVGLILSSGMIASGQIVQQDGAWVYTFANLKGVETLLPIAPSFDKTLVFGFDGASVSEVFLFGAFSGYNSFGSDLVHVLTTPASYIAIFSLIFVNLFDTTATLVAVGDKVGLIGEDGKMVGYRKAVLADATGALICGPMGTSTTTSFAESNVGVSFGARTGVSSLVVAAFFLLSIFIYPVFSIFTAGSVTACALVCVGITIVIGSFSQIDFKDPLVAFTAIVSVVFAALTYSITNGIGMAFICYVVTLSFSRRWREITPMMVTLAVLFLVSFVANAVMPLFQALANENRA